MCRVGGPRCAGSAAAKEHARELRRARSAARRMFAAGLVDRGVPAETARLSKKLTQASLPAAHRAAGYPDNSPCGPLTERDQEIVKLIHEGYTPTVELIQRIAVESPARMELFDAVEARNASRERLQRIQGQLKKAEESGDPAHVHSARKRVKSATFDDVTAERELERANTAYADVIRAAVRGEELVPTLSVGGDVPYDPAAENVLCAVGLTPYRTDAGHLKPRTGSYLENSLRKAGRGKPLPRPEDDLDTAIVASLGDGAHMVRSRVGDGRAAAYIDGVILGADGTVDAAVVRADDASRDRDGSLSAETRARALYALHAAGNDQSIGAVSRVIVTGLSGGEVRTETLTLDDSIDGTEDGLTLPEKLDEVAVNRTLMHEYAETGVLENKPSQRGPITDGSRMEKEAVSNLAALLHGKLSVNDIKKRLAVKKGAGASLDTAVRELIGEHWTRNGMGTLVGVDGETAGIVSDQRAFNPQYSEWIETGIVKHGSDGTETGRLSRLHGADARVIALNGTGAQNIHNIAPEDIEGKPSLAESKEAALVRDELLSGDVLIAHNVNFEKEHLGYNLPDFDGKRPWLDTQWLAEHFLPDRGNDGTSGAKLQHLVEDLGGEYTGAHRADRDAEMMMEALEKLFQRPEWWKSPYASTVES